MRVGRVAVVGLHGGWGVRSVVDRGGLDFGLWEGAWEVRWMGWIVLLVFGVAFGVGLAMRGGQVFSDEADDGLGRFSAKY